jgi:hypothetical protein
MAWVDPAYGDATISLADGKLFQFVVYISKTEVDEVPGQLLPLKWMVKDCIAAGIETDVVFYSHLPEEPSEVDLEDLWSGLKMKFEAITDPACHITLPDGRQATGPLTYPEGIATHQPDGTFLVPQVVCEAEFDFN